MINLIENLYFIDQYLNVVHLDFDPVVTKGASLLLIAAGAKIIDEPTVRDKNLISATSGEAGISVLLDMLAQVIQETKSN